MRYSSICRCWISAILAILLMGTVVSPASAQTSPAVELSTIPSSVQVAAGQTVDIAVQVANVSDLYAFDVLLAYDPAAVEVVDMDPSLDGIQVSLGTFLEPGFSILNLADNSLGRLRLAMTQLNPATPKSGTGTLLVVRLRGKQAGQPSAIEFVSAKLASPAGQDIPVGSTVNGQVQVVQTLSGPTNTPIPSQAVGTPLPTATPTSTGPTATAKSPAAQQPTPAAPAALPTSTPAPALPSATPAPSSAAAADTAVAAPPSATPTADEAAIAQDQTPTAPGQAGQPLRAATRTAKAIFKTSQASQATADALATAQATPTTVTETTTSSTPFSWWVVGGVVVILAAGLLFYFLRRR